MITIWKLTTSTFRLGITNFSKISFAMAGDWNAMIKLSQKWKNNVEITKQPDMNRSTAWKFVKKFQETGNTPNRSGAEENGVSVPLNSSKTPGKSCNKTFADAAEPWPPQLVWANSSCTRCWGTIWRGSPSRCSIARSLRTIMWPRGPKNAEISSRRWPTARCRTSCLRTRHSQREKSSLDFPRHPQREKSSPDPKIRSLSWFERPSQRPGGPLCSLCPLESNWTPSATWPTFWRVAYCPKPRSTFKEFPGFCNRTLDPFTLPR